jgi:RHS repeat-associated protein
VYDGANVVDELNGAGAVTAQYAQGAGIDEPLAASLGGTLAFYEADGLGSVTSLTDGTGSAVSAYTRDSFGKAVSTADTLGNRFRHTGREWDEETGLYYYRARYYDPSTGRFLSVDPILSEVNFHAYVTNNPATFIDPFGLRNCTQTPLGVVCYQDSTPETIQLDPHIPDLPTPQGLPKMPTPVPMSGNFCEPGTDCHDTLTGGLPKPTSGAGGFMPNPCQGWDFDSVRLPYRGPTFSCSGKTDPCLDAQKRFIDACEQAGCKGMVYNTGLTGAVSAACCQKQ